MPLKSRTGLIGSFSLSILYSFQPRHFLTDLNASPAKRQQIITNATAGLRMSTVQEVSSHTLVLPYLAPPARCPGRGDSAELFFPLHTATPAVAAPVCEPPLGERRVSDTNNPLSFSVPLQWVTFRTFIHPPSSSSSVTH